MRQQIRIGGASGFWGDAAHATSQLLADSNLDFIVYDYLAEITMSIMARARAKDPNKGYAVDFIPDALAGNLQEIEQQGVRIISNAGGVNPRACAAAIRELIKTSGCNLKVACVLGDDLLDQKAYFAEQQYREMFSGDEFPDISKVQSINAYLGAFPIARALDLGADIVITGRSVDSAVTLGACIHSFGWQPAHYDKLAMGSLAGHILECGPQATGGNFTDWEQVADQIDTLGYPIASIQPDGVFVCTKPAATGGLVSVGTVAEQMLYEIGDPQSYILPDVVCDFSAVTLTQVDDNRVKAEGAKGRAPTSTYKVSATYADEYRGGALMTFYGIDADKKAQAQSVAILRAAKRVLEQNGMPDFSETSVEILGNESQYGKFRKLSGAREVVLKIAAKHATPQGIGVLLKESVGLGLATPPGLSGFQSGRPKPSPVVRLFSVLYPKERLAIQIEMDDAVEAFEPADSAGDDSSTLQRPAAPATPETGDLVDVRLIELAWGRSGDKGNIANIGIIARRPEYLPYIYAALTENVIRDRFAHFLEAADAPGQVRDVEKFLLPGSHAINFVLHNVLGGGGISSIRSDPQAKGYAQLLLDMTIPVSPSIARLAGTSRSEP